MQEALTATEKFNKVSTNDWENSIWPLWDLWVDGAWEIWTSRSSEATDSSQKEAFAAPDKCCFYKCCPLFQKHRSQHLHG